MDYHIRPLGKVCAGTGNPLEPGTEVISVLAEVDGRLVRLDYSPEGWQGPPEGMVGQWKCVVPHPVTEKRQVVDPEEMLAYFEHLLENANPAEEKLAYVVSLYLLQRRRLILEGSRVDGDIEYLTLSGSRGEGPFEVRNQQLTEEEVQRLQLAIAQSLERGWTAAA